MPKNFNQILHVTLNRLENNKLLHSDVKQFITKHPIVSHTINENVLHLVDTTPIFSTTNGKSINNNDALYLQAIIDTFNNAKQLPSVTTIDFTKSNWKTTSFIEFI